MLITFIVTIMHLVWFVNTKPLAEMRMNWLLMIIEALQLVVFLELTLYLWPHTVEEREMIGNYVMNTTLALTGLYIICVLFFVVYDKLFAKCLNQRSIKRKIERKAALTRARSSLGSFATVESPKNKLPPTPPLLKDR